MISSRTRWLDGSADALEGLGQEGEEGFAWVHQGAGFATSGVAARVEVGTGPDRLGRAAADAATALAAIECDDAVGLPGTGPIAVGALPFADGVSGALVVPAVVIGRAPGGRRWITETGPPTEEARLAGRPVRSAGPLGREDYCAAVRQALAAIATGVVSKVVLARQVVVEVGAGTAGQAGAVGRDQGPSHGDVLAVARHLARRNPTCFTFAAGSFVGSTPELLARRYGPRVTSRPMAGSVPRSGGSEHDDRELLASLARSAKDQVEHRLVVEAVEAALAGLCDELEVSAAEVVPLPTVAHLASTVTGRLRAPFPSALDVVARLHPTPAVAGVPTAAALGVIGRLEGFERGLYAGPVGWVDARGDGEWAIALRCATLDGSRAVLSAGAGIVEGSDPEAEWAETEAKLAPMREALGSPAQTAYDS